MVRRLRIGSENGRGSMVVVPFSARLTRFIRKNTMPYLFITVPLITMMAFLFIPMIVSFWWSLNDYSGLQPPKFVGLENYIQLFTSDPIFIKTLINTTLFVLMGMGIGPSIGLMTALLLNQKVRFQSLFR